MTPTRRYGQPLRVDLFDIGIAAFGREPKPTRSYEGASAPTQTECRAAQPCLFVSRRRFDRDLAGAEVVQ
jgi:hypothetical protein